MNLDESLPDLGHATVDADGCLYVNGIEKWITRLIPVVKVNHDMKIVSDTKLAIFKDGKSGVKFIIGKCDQQEPVN